MQELLKFEYLSSLKIQQKLQLNFLAELKALHSIGSYTCPQQVQVHGGAYVIFKPTIRELLKFE